jgi:hypothetical protein
VARHFLYRLQNQKKYGNMGKPKKRSATKNVFVEKYDAIRRKL